MRDGGRPPCLLPLACLCLPCAAAAALLRCPVLPCPTPLLLCVPSPCAPCRQGVAHDPEGTGVVRHRDLVAGKGADLFPAAKEAAAGKQAAKRQKTDGEAKQQQPFDPSQVRARRRPSPAAAAAASLPRLLLLLQGSEEGPPVAGGSTAAANRAPNCPRPCLPACPPAGPPSRLQPFTLRSRQPWAEKEAEVVALTEEQKEYMAQVGGCVRV